jgi:hypothetical protein
MVPIAPNASSTPRCSIDRPGAAPGQALDSTRQRPPGIRLDDEMDVVGLNRKMNHAKVDAIGSRQGAAQRPKSSVCAQRR